MLQNKRKLIHLIYGVFLSVIIIITAFSLIYACLSIYDGKSGNFSRDAVASWFSKIGILIYVAIGAVIIGFILPLVLPADKNASGEKRAKPAQNHSMTRSRLAKKVSLELCESSLAANIRRERKIRLISRCVCIGLYSFAAIPLLIYICNPSNYDKYKINESIIPAVSLVIIWCVLAFIYCLLLGLISYRSTKREISLLKEAVAQKAIAASMEDNGRPNAKITAINCTRAIILAVAVIFIILGISNGGMADVLGKAIRLCTECIGLG